MVIKRQKIFFIGALMNGGMLAMTGAQMAQSSSQAAEAEEQNRQQIKATNRATRQNSEDAEKLRRTQEKIGKQQVAAMNKIAKAAKDNPMVAQQFVDQTQDPQQAMYSQKEFAAVNGQFLKNATGFAKDMSKFAWGHRRAVGKGLIAGGAMAGVGYGIDKVIQSDIKRNNLPFLPDKSQNQQKQFGATGSVLGQAKNLGKRALNFGKNEIKSGWKGHLGFGALFGGMGAVGYLADKAQYKDQMRATQPQQQKQFANLGAIKGIGSNISKFFKNPGASIKGAYGKGKEFITNEPGRKTLDGVAKWMYGENGGRKGFVSGLSKIGNESKNPWTQKTADFLNKHKKTAAVAAIGTGGAIMSAGWGQGEKLTKKALKAVDKNAFAYEESKNQPVSQ